MTATVPGQLLRIYQQYFMVSNGAVHPDGCEQKGYDLHTLYDHVVIQINDTHPSMVIRADPSAAGEALPCRKPSML